MNDTLTKIADEAERVQLSEQTAKTLATFDKAVDQVFDEAMASIKRVRHACDTAEEMLKTRRNAVKSTMNGFIGTIQVTANVTDDAQRAIGEMLVNGDQV